MKIFISHSSKDKPLVREVISYLPKRITSWIDENDLPVGANITKTLEDTINVAADLVILFVSHESVASDWVMKEIEWALNREEQRGNIFLLPVVLYDKSAWSKIKIKKIHDKKYLFLNSNEKIDIESLSKKIENEILNWLVSKNDQEKNSSVKPNESYKKVISMIEDFPSRQAKTEVFGIAASSIYIIIYYIYIHNNFPVSLYIERNDISFLQYYFSLPSWFQGISIIIAISLLFIFLWSYFLEAKIKSAIMNTLNEQEKRNIISTIKTSRNFKGLVKDIERSVGIK